MLTSPDPAGNSRDAVSGSEKRLEESLTVRREADFEFARLRHNLETNHFAESVRLALTGEPRYGRS